MKQATEDRDLVVAAACKSQIAELRAKLPESATEPEPEPEPVTAASRWKKMNVKKAVDKGTMSGVIAAAAERKKQLSRRRSWGIGAADRYRLATVLRDERPKWEKHMRAKAKWADGVRADQLRAAATIIEARFRGNRRRRQLVAQGEKTADQSTRLLDGLGVGRHIERFLKCGWSFQQLLVAREDQLGEERGWVTKKLAMAAWGMNASERQRVRKALPVEKAKWERTKKMVLVKKSKTERKYSDLDKKVKAVFDAIDADGSGEIDKAEFGQLMVALGIGMSQKQLTEAWRWMDKDRGGGLDFDEFFNWWRANRDGAADRGFLAGGGLSQNAEQAEGTDAKSISAFSAMFAAESIDGDALTGALDRVQEEQRRSRPADTGATGSVSGDGLSGGLRWSTGGTNIALSNTSTLAYMGAHGGHLDWKNPKDISVPGEKWKPPERKRPEKPIMSEWLGGANDERRQEPEVPETVPVPVNRGVKVGRTVRVMWEETARAAVERCAAIGSGWTEERAARCGDQGIVRAVDPDGTCRVHFPPREPDMLQALLSVSGGGDEDEIASQAAAQAFSARHEGFGFGAGVVQAANDAVKAAAAAREKEAREAAAAARIKSGDAAREEVIWWPVDAVEPAPGESSEEEDGNAFALVEAGQKPLNPRVVGYEISCCSKNELNGSYDVSHWDGEVTTSFRQTTGEHWLVWHAVGYGGGQWFVGDAIGLRVTGGQGGVPGGANRAFAAGRKDRPAPRHGWYVSTLAAGNGGYVLEENMVVRAVLADGRSVASINEVSNERVRQSWIEIGLKTRQEAHQTLQRYGCLGTGRLIAKSDRDAIAALEECRNTLRQAAEVSQSFGDANGWAAALTLQAECCAALGKERLVGTLKLKARAVLDEISPEEEAAALLPQIKHARTAAPLPQDAVRATGRPDEGRPGRVLRSTSPENPLLLEYAPPAAPPAVALSLLENSVEVRPRSTDERDTKEKLPRERRLSDRQAEKAYSTLPSALPNMIW